MKINIDFSEKQIQLLIDGLRAAADAASFCGAEEMSDEYIDLNEYIEKILGVQTSEQRP